MDEHICGSPVTMIRSAGEHAVAAAHPIGGQTTFSTDGKGSNSKPPQSDERVGSSGDSQFNPRPQR